MILEENVRQFLVEETNIFWTRKHTGILPRPKSRNSRTRIHFYPRIPALEIDFGSVCNFLCLQFLTVYVICELSTSLSFRKDGWRFSVKAVCPLHMCGFYLLFCKMHSWFTKQKI
jgi:hypothetical protein